MKICRETTFFDEIRCFYQKMFILYKIKRKYEMYQIAHKICCFIIFFIFYKKTYFFKILDDIFKKLAQKPFPVQ